MRKKIFYFLSLISFLFLLSGIVDIIKGKYEIKMSFFISLISFAFFFLFFGIGTILEKIEELDVPRKKEDDNDGEESKTD